MRIVPELAQSKELILSTAFRTYSMADKYRELSARTGLDFSASIRLLEHLPIFMDGDVHLEVRKVMAKQISRTQECQFSSLSAVLDRLVAERFVAGAALDLVKDFCHPIWRSISNAIVPRDESNLSLVDDIPSLFFPTVSIRSRLEINGRIKSFLEFHPDEEDDQLILLCLAVLGARPFLGGLALSLYGIMEENADIPLCGISWPESFPVSALRYVDRIHGSPDGQQAPGFEPNERVRCVTNSPEWTPLENRQALFGFGAHTCIGKSVSEKSWKMITARLSQSPLRATCHGLTISQHSEPFHMPESALIRLR